MDSREMRAYWNKNADAWTKLSRAGYDIYRDSFNTPAFLEFLPEVDGLKGIDIGCGEGHNTRLLATKGARMTGTDISAVFIDHAQEEETRHGLGIDYVIADAAELPFEDERFNFATAFMSLMDMPSPDRVLHEAFRVLRPGGFFQFSISHPCFDTRYRRNLRDEDGRTYAIEVGDYFERTNGEVMRWIFSSAPEEAKEGLSLFEVPRFRRTLAEWINMSIDASFLIERIAEPRPSDEVVREFPGVQDAQIVSYFLHVRLRKPSPRSREDRGQAPQSGTRP